MGPRFKPEIEEGDDIGLLCPRCGMKGTHGRWAECIDALRDRVAVAEMETIHWRGRFVAVTGAEGQERRRRRYAAREQAAAPA